MSDTPQDDDLDGVFLGAEIMDRAERKAKKEQAKKEAEDQAPKKQKKPDPTKDEIEAALAQSSLAQAEKAKRKKYFKLGGSALAAGLVIWAGTYLFAPFKAGVTYGVCKTYLELNVRFPQDLRISTVEDFGSYVRIWYTQLDAFGEYRMEQIQCHFRSDEVTGAAVDKITINRREVDPQKIADFNVSLPAILANPPDLTIPYPLPDSLKGLQINTDAFRFQLNLPQTNFFGERK